MALSRKEKFERINAVRPIDETLLKCRPFSRVYAKKCFGQCRSIRSSQYGI